MHLEIMNMNPWGKKIGDCAIRAVSAALAIKYPAVCQMFRRKCVPGLGLSGEEGIDLETIKRRLDRFFDRVEDANEISWKDRPPEFADMEFDPAFDLEPDLGLTLDEFCEAYRGTGRYLVALVHDVAKIEKGRNMAGHIVYADLRPGKNVFFDTWNCGGMIVETYMKVKAVLDFKDPRSLYYGRK